MFPMYECVLALGLHELVHSQGWVAAGRAPDVKTYAKLVVWRPQRKGASQRKREISKFKFKWHTYLNST